MAQADLHAAQELHQQGLLTEAEKAYLAILKKDPNDVAALHGLGILNAQQNHPKEAIAFIQNALALQPDNASLYVDLANIYKSTQQYALAVTALEEALTLKPHYAVALNNLGTIYFAQDKLKEATRNYQQAIKEDHHYLEAHYNLGLAYAKQSDFLSAKTSYETILSIAPTHPAANFQLGLLSIEEGNLSQALRHLLLVEKYHPFHFETQSNLATCYLKSGEIETAKEHYLKALEIQPNDTQVMFNLAVIMMQQGHTDKAIQLYQRVIQNDHDFFAAHNNLGVAFLTKNHIPYALQHFKEAQRLQPHNAAIDYTVRMLSQDQRLETSPPDYIKTLFNAYADHYEDHLLQSLEYALPQTLLSTVQTITTLAPASISILDLGCGTGLCGEIFKPYASRMFGVDLSENMLAVAEKKHIYNELICADLTTFLTNTTETFQLILAGDVLVYIGDLRNIMLQIARVLSPQGLFIFNTEISDEPKFKVSQSGRFIHNKAYLETLAQENNLKVVSYQKVITRQQLNQPVYGHLFVLQK